jgi:hypothetical protein
MTEQERALLTVTAKWPDIGPEQALLMVVAALHGLGAMALIMAPDVQLFTQGTRPVFDLFPPNVWAVAFIVGALCACALLQRPTAVRQLLTWITVLPTQAVWLAASVMAVSRGGGSAMGVVFLMAVFAFTVVTAWLVMVDATPTGR